MFAYHNERVLDRQASTDRRRFMQPQRKIGMAILTARICGQLSELGNGRHGKTCKEVHGIIAEEKGGVLGVGLVYDTDHPAESGIHFTAGRGFGRNVGVGVGGGVCARDIEGPGWKVDRNLAVMLP